MKITKSMLEDFNACNDGLGWFEENFPEGGEYQTVLDKLGAENNYPYAKWLMNRIPAENSILEIDEIKIDGSLFFAGKVIVKKGISITGYLNAGQSIEAGNSIEAGQGIAAGWDIAAGNSIEAGNGIAAGRGIAAGDDYGIFAGVKVKIGNWEIGAKVIAKSKPQNLISGFWVEPEGEEK